MSAARRGEVYLVAYIGNGTSLTLSDKYNSKNYTIYQYAFSGCTGLTTVYYRGSSSQWSRISIGSYNDPLNNATKVYNYTGA